MRAPHTRFAVIRRMLLVAAGVAVLALAGVLEASASRMGGGRPMGGMSKSMGGMSKSMNSQKFGGFNKSYSSQKMLGSNKFGSNKFSATKKLNPSKPTKYGSAGQKFKNPKHSSLSPNSNIKPTTKYPSSVKPTGPKHTTPGSTKPTDPKTTHDPKGPGRPTGPGSAGTHYPPRPPIRPVRPPSLGPIVPPLVGTGVVVAAPPVLAGVTPAAPPPPSPPRSSGGPGPGLSSGPGAQPPSGPTSGINIPPANEQRFVPNEVVLEFAGTLSTAAINQLTARHRLARLESQSFAVSNSTYLRARITDGRPVRTVLRALASEVSLQSGQPNYLYATSQQDRGVQILPAIQLPETFEPPPAATPAPTPVVASTGARPAAGDPAQYALTKLRLAEAHSLARGDNILVAVIDSGVDAGHPEFASMIAGTFDALGSGEKPHPHGTGIAGAIAAHSRLMGVAPAARILAIRAFGASGTRAEATSFAILKGIDHAVISGARVINMSFAGPADPSMARHIASARLNGVVLVAAVGNFGPTSPPQYPAADPNVIAVTATDAEDNLFVASNRGGHVAIAAPGVDILLPAPEANYQMTSGTSFAAAHVSGIVALMLQRQPTLSPDAVRQILVATAKDLGPPGKDAQFGAGLADAYQAVLALEPRAVAQPTADAR
jgi:hypothetical protein